MAHYHRSGGFYKVLIAAWMAIESIEDAFDMIPSSRKWDEIPSETLKTLFQRKEESTFFGRKSCEELRSSLESLEEWCQELRDEYHSLDRGDPERERIPPVFQRQIRLREALRFELEQVRSALSDADMKKHPDVPEFKPPH